MSEQFDFDLQDVEDFADVSLENAADYNDQTDPAPLDPGNWVLRVDEAKRATNQYGEPQDDNGYPQVQLNKLTVVEPEEFAGRAIYPFKKYSLRPIQAGKRKGAVPAVDLLRGFDDTLTFSTGKELLQLLGQQFENGATFKAATNWVAKDSEFIKEQIDENGGSLDDLSDEDKTKLFNKAIIRGQKRFPKVNGFFVPEVEGPSGDKLRAKVDLTRIYPSSKEVKRMGPGKKA